MKPLTGVSRFLGLGTISEYVYIKNNNNKNKILCRNPGVRNWVTKEKIEWKRARLI